MKVIHRKQDASQIIQTRVMDCTSAIHSQTGQGIIILDNLLSNPTEATTTTTTTTSTQTLPQKKTLKTTRNNDIHPGLSSSQNKRKVNAQKIISSWSPNRNTFKSPIKRRLFSQMDNHYEDPVEEELRMTKICVGGREIFIFVFVSLFCQALLLLSIHAAIYYSFPSRFSSFSSSPSAFCGAVNPRFYGCWV